MERTTAALAGLLHDIGKFWQRSERQARGPGYESFGPSDFGRHGAHATWSAAFVDRFVPSSMQEIKQAVFFHHNPQDRAAKLVAVADRLASGEREHEDEEQPRNLLSVFCQLGEDNHCSPSAAYFPLRPLDLTAETLFPQAHASGDVHAYAALWTAFQDEVQALDTVDDVDAYIESMYHLLYRYAWCVPSAYYRSTPDISLFDHSRVTAALAACLADYDEAALDLLLKGMRGDRTHPVAYLVEGDISGVQRFIFTLTAKGAAKGLRGRSFYLQLLTEAIARYLLRQLDLPMTNLIYVGGGHFYLLAPPSASEPLRAAQEHLDAVLLEHHDGALYVGLGKTLLYPGDFQASEFSQKWREVGQDVGRAKRRRFAGRAEVFEPRGHGGYDETECDVCHTERDDVRVSNPGEEDEEPVRKCALCLSLEELGHALGRSANLVLGESSAPLAEARGTWQDAIGALGMTVGLTDEQGRWTLRPAIDRIHRATVLGLQTAPTQELVEHLGHQLGSSVASGVRFAVNVTPDVSFDELTQASQGLKRLGVLRMDVDDLGYLFSQGFRRSNNKHLSTLARVASLSSMLALYFEGWVGQLAEQVNQEARKGVVYTIYSGGDDLFFVGAWDALPTLADRIRRDLARFTSGNRFIHVSAGISLHGKKHPLYQAASEAASALDQAKDRPGKNAWTFLGQTNSWDDYERAEELVNRLLELEQHPRVGRSLFRVLLQIHNEYRTARSHTRSGRDQVIYGPWMWHCTYLLSRMAQRAGGDAEKQLRELESELSLNHFRGIELVGLAARWAEARTKPESHDGEDTK